LNVCSDDITNHRGACVEHQSNSDALQAGAWINHLPAPVLLFYKRQRNRRDGCEKNSENHRGFSALEVSLDFTLPHDGKQHRTDVSVEWYSGDSKISVDLSFAYKAQRLCQVQRHYCSSYVKGDTCRHVNRPTDVKVPVFEPVERSYFILDTRLLLNLSETGSRIGLSGVHFFFELSFSRQPGFFNVQDVKNSCDYTEEDTARAKHSELHNRMFLKDEQNHGKGQHGDVCCVRKAIS